MIKALENPNAPIYKIDTQKDWDWGCFCIRKRNTRYEITGPAAELQRIENRKVAAGLRAKGLCASMPAKHDCLCTGENMAGTLSVMYGASDYLEPLTLDPRGKTDFDAGLIFLSTAARVFPGLTWRDLVTWNSRAGRPFMAGWWTDLKKSVGDIKDGIGDVVSDTVDLFGRKGGDVVRLATDDKVAETVLRAGAAYASGGASEAARALTPEQRAAAEAAGASYKMNLAGMNPWMLGGLGLAALLVVALVARPAPAPR